MEKMRSGKQQTLARKPHSGKLVIYTDGASRGNPGPGAIAFLIYGSGGEIVKQHAEFIGNCTNNIAEYRALVSALKSASGLGASEIECFSDSRLVMSQMRGEFKVRQGRLMELREAAKALERGFAKVAYHDVRRTDPNIQKADAMVNDVLDQVMRR